MNINKLPTGKEIYIPSIYLYKFCFDQPQKEQIKIYNFLSNSKQEVSVQYWAMLENCIEGKTLENLYEEYCANWINDALIQQHLVIADDLWSIHKLNAFEIETSTVCNWQCVYCPNHWHQREAKYMDMELYCEIIEKIAEFKSAQYVALHFYNEPMADPLFFSRVELLNKYNLPLALSTNAYYMDTTAIQFLMKHNINRVVVNFPSADPDTFYQLTGCKSFNRVVSNIQELLNSSLPVEVSVHSDKETKRSICNLFHIKIEDLSNIETVDRAGILKNGYFNNIYLNSNDFVGCILPNQRMYITIDGFCVLCCQDFFQKHRYANIKDGSIQDIFSYKLAQYRKMLWGGTAAKQHLICSNCKIMSNTKKQLRMCFNIYESKFKER